MSHKSSTSSTGTSRISDDPSCLDDKCSIDDPCGKMHVWCWPTGPKNFLGPCKYDRSNFWRIPTGSLYFASRKGPLSEMNARVTGSPYDLVGIVFQSKTHDKEGTYVYTVDSTFILDNKLTNRVVVLNLEDLVTDDSIIYHAILPLKDFDDGGVQPADFPKSRRIGDDHGKHEPVAFEAVERWARKFDESCSSSSNSHRRYRSRKGDEEKGCRIRHSKYDSSSSDSDSDCDSSSDSSDVSSCSSSSSSSSSGVCAPESGGCGSYSESDGCIDAKSWRYKLREKRNEVLKDLLKKYYDMKPEHDAYQVLASIVGLPVAESLRSRNAYTAPELVGLILFQAGLIWDDHFATCNRNPVCCFDKCFFQKIIEKTNETNNEVQAVITLTTPKAYAESKYSDTRLSKTDTRSPSEYPDACYESDTETDTKTKSKTEKKSDKTKTKSKTEKKKESDSTDQSDVEADDVKLRKNLQKHLDQSLKQGAAEALQPTEDKEKGCYDYYGCDDESSYKRCCYPAKWYGSNDCYSSCYNSSNSSGPWPKPCPKDVHARTIFFGSLRPVDFLIDYYRATGIDPNGHLNLAEVKPLTGRNGQAGELVAIIHSLAAQRARGDLLDYDINKINMSWYHDNLIPIELCNNTAEDCCDQIERECKYMRELVCQIDRTFIQKKQLNADNAGFTGSRLLKICRRTSELAAELHCLAAELDTYVVRCGSGSWRHIGDCEDDSQYSGPGECRFKLRIDSCSDRCATDYLIVLNKYMWASGWEYHWKKPLCVSSSKYYYLMCRTKKLLADLLDLKNRTPVTCIILELIVTLLEQTRRLYKYLCKSRKHCCDSSSSSSSSSSSYRHHKGGEVNAAGLIDEAFPEKIKE